MTELKIPAGFRLRNGWLWPAYDTDCARVVFRMSKDLDAVMRHVPEDKRGVVVQAGGNCGVWPRVLAGLFGTVYTFEPDPLNFAALTFNTAHLPNVIRMQAALGNDRAKVRLELADHETNNCGALYVQPGGVIPTLRVDDLHLSECGLLYLDIEGYEVNALRSANLTIRNCRPVIVIEDKGLSEKYGAPQGFAVKWLAHFYGYKVLERINKDVILGP